MPKIDIDQLPVQAGSIYPEPFRAICEGCLKHRLGDAGGLTQFGVNLTRLLPGAATAQRHWHESEDELVFVVSGEVTLIDDGGETPLAAGEAAAFKAGVSNGHQVVNRSDADAVLLEIGSRFAEERGHYPDIDLVYERSAGSFRFTTKRGEPYS